MKKINLLLIMTSCVLLTGSIFPGNLFAETVTEEWVARYNGPANYDDGTTAMALDSSGNVYVTGFSYGSDTYKEYATIKYDTSGNELWVASYNGPGGYQDVANAIAVDGSGNVYVTGRSHGGDTDRDYATIKYDTNGNELWVARYNGPANSWDTANAIAVDSSGNVYVTGHSHGGDTDRDYATIKYDTNGNELWVARYNGPGNTNDGPIAIALDTACNVYVTGSGYLGTVDSADYATVKYDGADGTQLWAARYNGTGNSKDLARDMAVDASGNVYVTGRSYGGGTYDDYATVKYDTDGNEKWVARYNNRFDVAAAIALDTAGNVYVTGFSDGSETNADYATIKYDTSGNEVWVARYDGPANGNDQARVIDVDASGNVYVAGYSSALCTQCEDRNYDYATVKYDTNGNQLWVARYNGPANSRDFPFAIAVDSSGNVYVSGESGGSDTSADYATIKYSRLTPPGQDVVVKPVDPVTGETPITLTFEEVTEGGVTTVTSTTPGEEQGAPEGFKFGSPPVIYEISTAATFTGQIEVCFDYSNTSYGDEANLKLFHREGSNWVDITSFLDTDNNIICGTVTSFSFFGAFELVDPVVLLGELAGKVFGLNLQHGIENSLDAKLDAALKALEDVNNNNDAAAINTLEAFINAVEAQSGNQIPEADADALIAAALEIIAVLSGA